MVRHLTNCPRVLNNYKNSNYGWPTGDRTLIELANILSDSVRSLDWVARYGGEEFCVVMPDTRIEQGIQIAERICKILRSQTVCAFDGRKFEITASIGVVEMNHNDEGVEKLIQRASDMARKAKKTRKDKVCWEDAVPTVSPSKKGIRLG